PPGDPGDVAQPHAARACDLELALRAHAAGARPSHVVGGVRCAAVVGVTSHAGGDAPRGPRDRPFHARQSGPDVRPEILIGPRPDPIPAAARRHAYAVAPDTPVAWQRSASPPVERAGAGVVAGGAAVVVLVAQPARASSSTNPTATAMMVVTARLNETL